MIHRSSLRTVETKPVSFYMILLYDILNETGVAKLLCQSSCQN